MSRLGHATLLQYFRMTNLVYSEGGVGRLVVDPLEVGVGFILHLLGDALVTVGEQGRDVAGPNL